MSLFARLPPRTRSLILTIGITAITVTGAFYGAGLKIEKEEKEIKEQAREHPIAFQIAQAEEYRASLLQQRIIYEKKIAAARERAEEKRRQAAAAEEE